MDTLTVVVLLALGFAWGAGWRDLTADARRTPTPVEEG